jgi:hypothetical protein
MRAELVTVALLAACAGGGSHQPQPDAASGSGMHVDGAPADAPYNATLDGNRDRLLATYLAWLQTQPDTQQSNGLLGRELSSTCDLWAKLDPSSRGVFLTITHRMYGSVLADGTHMLDHVGKLYRVIGGEGATATSAGSCGGGEYNRMIMQIDPALHAAQLAANQRKGAAPYDVADVVSTSFWRDSHDLGGPHAPFDLSDETNSGAPRGQTQYFKDPASTAANSPLGRMDLMTLVDPYAMEMDQDYDCVHNSNPTCDYVFYGPGCLPETQQEGVQIYTQNYGDIEPGWVPTGC